MGLEAKIQNSKLLTDIFRRWPSFHDAEVVRIGLERIDRQAHLEACIHLFEGTSEIQNGRYVLKNHTLATLRFIGITNLKLDGFNHQNVLFGLDIREISAESGGNFGVTFQGCFGVAADFQCNAIRIESAEPFPKPGL